MAEIKTQDLPEPSAHMFPSDLERFAKTEATATAFSVSVGNPDERSVPLYTLTQVVEYAESLRATSQPVNQCDGCQSGAQLDGSMHRAPDGKPIMVCQAHRYTTSQPVGVPEGWKLVPVEPPAEMTWAATVTADREWCYHVGRDDAKKLWAAMLAASPAIIAITPSAAVITDAQITAGAAVLDARGKPIGRNVAIDVFEAMCAAIALTASPTPPAAHADGSPLSRLLPLVLECLRHEQYESALALAEQLQAETSAAPTAAGDEAKRCIAAQTLALVEECRAALSEELRAWDIDPPLHHVKQAHDKCVLWLDAAKAEAGKVGG